MTSSADDGFPLGIEALLASAYKLLKARGSNVTASILMRADAHGYQADYDNWNGGTSIWALRLGLDIDDYAVLSDSQRDAMRDELSDAVGSFFATLPSDSFGRVVLSPKVSKDPDWRNGVKFSAGPVFLLEKDWRELGQGGFGIVYAIKDTRLDIDFALKVFDPSPFNSSQDGRERFLREAGLLFRLHHENIVRIFDAGELPNGKPFIKMEYFPGVSLQALLDSRSVSAEEALHIVGRLTAALEHSHSRSIFHRDIKPTNILVSQSLDSVRLIDFGLGILVEEAASRARLTRSDQQFGGVYSSPELLENPRTADCYVDIYSVGAVWFRLVCGRAPQGAGLESVIADSGLDADAKTLLRRCLGTVHERPTASELLQKLRSLWKRKRVLGVTERA